MCVKKLTSFCQIPKKMHAKENWFLSSASWCRTRTIRRWVVVNVLFRAPGRPVCIPLHGQWHHTAPCRLELVWHSVRVPAHGRAQWSLDTLPYQQRLRGSGGSLFPEVVRRRSYVTWENLLGFDSTVSRQLYCQKLRKSVSGSLHHLLRLKSKTLVSDQKFGARPG